MNRRDFLAGCSALATASILRSPVEAFAQQPLADMSLTIAPLELEIAPGKTIHTIAYNGSVPGPLIRWPQGKPITIEVLNQTSDPD
ncbi:MAG TPA: multicopper oxidase domain-containing protein, partial [Pseudacidobacterium sp.]|nr:multicopper oxidase domain-containing protein [Pseudacidobacterium sp.]